MEVKAFLGRRRPSDAPWVMKKSEINEDFVRLHYSEVTAMPTKKNYLEHEVLKLKCIQDLKVDSYVVNMKKLSKVVQFYMNVHSNTKITYLTGQYFTLGLQWVTSGSEHVIKNLAHGVPIFLFACARKGQRYIMHANSNKALVNKTWIVEDFDQIPIQPEMVQRIPPNTVYFLYTVSHSKFILERLDKIIVGTPSLCSQQAEKNEGMEGTNACLPKKVERLDRTIVGTPSLCSQQTEKNEGRDETIIGTPALWSQPTEQNERLEETNACLPKKVERLDETIVGTASVWSQQTEQNEKLDETIVGTPPLWSQQTEQNERLDETTVGTPSVCSQQTERNEKLDETIVGTPPLWSQQTKQNERLDETIVGTPSLWSQQTEQNERRDETIDGTPSLWSQQTEQNERLEETNACLLKKVERLDRQNTELTAKNERLAAKKRQLLLKIESLEATVTTLQERLKSYEDEEPRRKRPADSTMASPESEPEVIEIDCSFDDVPADWLQTLGTLKAERK